MQQIEKPWREPLTIGPVTARNRVFLAPMSGISDLPFRRLAGEFGAGLVVTEMVASRELATDSRESWARLRSSGISPHVVQLAGREAHWMAEAARIAEAEGADMIDINMGCPAKKVTGGYSGSALMRDPERALSLIEATVGAVSVPVTLKMRLGWDENSLNAAVIARNAVSAGIRMLTIHGRTRCQFYKGKADWSAIARVRDAVDIPFVANGDIASQADIATCLSVTGADAVMIGRASQGRPWLCGELAGAVSVPEDDISRRRIALRHHAMMIEHYGDDVGVRHARKHVASYLEHLAPATPVELKSAIMSTLEPAQAYSLFREALEMAPQSADLEDAA